MAKKIKKSTSEKLRSRLRRHFRIRKKISGTPEMPRFCVIRSSKALAVQVIDDEAQKTIYSARTAFKKTANCVDAEKLGKEVAEGLKAKGVQAVRFDRGGFIYHGKIASLAKGAREAGLTF